MSAYYVQHNNAFNVHRDVEKEVMPFGLTVHELLVSKGFLHDDGGRYVRACPFIPFLNGSPILEKDWPTLISENDVVQVCRMPKGGGGGSNMNNIIVGIIAAVMAYFTFGMSLVASAAVGVGVAVGMKLLTASVAAPKAGAQGNSTAAGSTYSLNAQSNEARLLEAIPRLYGTFRVVPDFAAQPYSEFVENQQILYQLFAVSLGEVDVDEIVIDETNITSYADAQWQVIKPGGRVTLFPDNVITSDSVQSIELPTPGSVPNNIIGPFVVSSTPVNHLGFDFSFPRGIGRIDDNGNDSTHSVTIVGQYRLVGTTAWIDGVREEITGANQTPQFRSFKFQVPLGVYETQAYKATGTADNRSFDTVQWVSVKGYVDGQHDYGDMTLVATRMVATNALNSTTARKFFVTGTAKLQTWNPTDGWGPRVRTNSIAWACADILRDPNYGRGLPTSRIGMENLYRLHLVWESRGDTFNGTFDSKSQLWEALTTVARCGRATPVYYAGVIDFIRDEPATIVTAQFTPATMVKGSFSTTYKFFSQETPDHVIVEYTDKETWKTAEVSCALPGSTKLNPYRVRLKGCTDRDHAYREGMSMAAGNRDRRRSIEFTTLQGGLIPEFNGLIRVQHDVPQWGYYGRVLNFDKVTGAIRTSEPIPVPFALTTLIAFRKRDGSEDGPYEFQKNPDLDEENREFGGYVIGTPEELSEIYISDGYREDYTQYIAGPSEQRGIKCLVTNCKPDSEGRVAISAVNYADSVHTAENGGLVPPPPPESNLPNINAMPIIDKVEVLYTVTVGEQNIIATVGRAGIYYEFEARIVGGNWIRLGTADKPVMRSNLAPGTWSVRVRGIGRVPGPWTTWNGTIEATTLPTPTISLFRATAKMFAIGLEWAYGAETLSITARVEIRQGVTDIFGNSTPLVDLPYPANAFTFDNLGPAEVRYFWARAIDTAGRPGPWFNNGQALRGISDANYDKVTQALLNKVGEEQLTQALREKINEPQIDLGPVYAEIERVDEERIAGDESLAQAQEVLRAGQEATAARVEQVNTASAQRDQALGEQVTTVSAVADTAQGTASNAQAAAQAASDLAGGKGKVFFQTGEPPVGERLLQNLWIDTTNGANTPKRWNGAAWAPVTDKVATDAAIAAMNAQDTANIARADVQVTSTALAKTNGDLAAMYTIKTQVNVNGVLYMAGLGIGVENTSGIQTSSIVMIADKLVLLNPNTNALESPFMIVGGNTYIKSAFIQKAVITEALIGATITSVAVITTGPNTGWPVMTTNYDIGSTVYRGVGFTRTDNASGTQMMDMTTGVVVLEWGDI